MSSVHVNFTAGLLVCIPIILLVIWIVTPQQQKPKKKELKVSFLHDPDAIPSSRDIVELIPEQNYKVKTLPRRVRYIKVINVTQKAINIYFAQPLDSVKDLNSLNPSTFGEERFIAVLEPGVVTKIKGRVFQIGNVLRFSVNLKGKEEKLFDYVISSSPRRDALFVGMKSLRYIGHAYDKSRAITTTASNAVGGQPWVTLHNPSYRVMSLNEGRIKIEPHSQTIYKGYTHTGVPLGQIFQDDDGIYPIHVYTKPYSDIYFGVVSDIKQTDEGCWQLEFNDLCDFGQTLWPMEEGIY